MSDIIDINVQETIDQVDIIVNPNLYVINVNRVIGEQVQSDWTQVDINAPDYIKNKPEIVPYTGATQDLNLGEFGLQTGNIEFDNTPTNIPTGAGSMYWNDVDGTLDLKLKGGNVTLQIGQEQVLRVVNKTATNVNLLESNYQAVRVTGAQGQRLKIDLAKATNDVLSAETIGLVTETINNNQEGFITTSGLVRNINTTGSLQGETWADGDIVYLSPTTAGNITNIKPIAPNHLIIIGYVIHAHITQGTIFVKVDNGYELNELHNVNINELTLSNNDLLQYNSTTQLWQNKSIKDAYHILFPPKVGSTYNLSITSALNTSAAPLGTTGVYLMPFIPKHNITISSLKMNVIGTSVGNNARILVYDNDNVNNVPNNKIIESTNLDCSTSGFKVYNTINTFLGYNVYWVGLQLQGNHTISQYVITNLFPLEASATVSSTTFYGRLIPCNFGAAPTLAGSTTLVSGINAPMVWLTV